MSLRAFAAVAAALVLSSCYFARGSVNSGRTEPGRPIADPDPADAYEVWHDHGGWHLRARSDAGRVFEGLVLGNVRRVSPVGVAPEALRAAGGAVAFSFVPGAQGEAGFDWQGGCAEFSLYVDGDARPLRIFAGAFGASPPRIPFSLCP
jgi:hypothetical protein